MRGRQLGLVLVLLLAAPVGSLSAAEARSWQDGELLSRKTVPMGRTFLHNRYVYRVRSLNRDYLVVAETPLHLDLHVPMKFSPAGRQIWIQDADGHEQKVQILQRASTSMRQ